MKTQTPRPKPEHVAARTREPPPEDLIDEALEGSFPASDPPFWTLGLETTAAPPRERASAPVEQPRAEPSERMVRDMMTRDVTWVPIDMPLGRVASELAARQVNGAAVCARDGTVVGMISKTDLTELYGAENEHRIARDAMTPEVLSIRADESMHRAVRTMAAENVHQLVVLDEAERMVGVVTSMDVLRELALRGE